MVHPCCKYWKGEGGRAFCLNGCMCHYGAWNITENVIYHNSPQLPNQRFVAMCCFERLPYQPINKKNQEKEQRRASRPWHVHKIEAINFGAMDSTVSAFSLILHDCLCIDLCSPPPPPASKALCHVLV